MRASVCVLCVRVCVCVYVTGNSLNSYTIGGGL